VRLAAGKLNSALKVAGSNRFLSPHQNNKSQLERAIDLCHGTHAPQAQNATRLALKRFF
jgi:hypothetical protein